ncbi:capsule assembly protein Wzi domain protein [Treponema socranskii subsp. socranskii VPI DR56BR1116 = ATCC 35536]|uniref:Capsule assembly protein Wzi domain protein n=2 Tax=Treponema socranskii TaxID=53419 RepID=U2L9Z7_TRESO|nr:capsule assembly protein Wzi domain protein [Treponema socranskii subsp. socranskii VPI DR56BR1116 = ATCC 35536]ERK01308.1 capsule assembly protein Wzi domain protein [Treponema socranskii subsp. socranskii VPI DR56BR1116 = ATCC 35536]
MSSASLTIPMQSIIIVAMNISKKLSALPLVFALAYGSISAQEALKSIEENYYDFLSLTGVVERASLGYRTLSDSVWNFIDAADKDEANAYPFCNTENIWQNNNLGTTRFISGNKNLSWKIYGPEWYQSFNTAAPYGQNDGALWQGRGYNTSLTGGARLQAYGVELTLKPQLSFSQNAAFELKNREVTDPNASEYGYFWGYKLSDGSYAGIDAPQRFGNKPFFTFDWGDTEIRYTWKTLTVGFGTQSPWLGPAILNPMLGSNNAASYPKIDFGVRRTSIRLPWLKWYVGDIEARMWTGMLTESDYFDKDASNDHTMINGISLSYAPSFIPGLTVGLNRIFLTKWNWKNLKYIGRLFTTSHANDVSGDGEDQKIAFNAAWRFPQIGFTVYGELGIDDYTTSETRNPFHTAVYTVGLHQYIPLPLYKLFPNKLAGVNLHSELLFEWNNFEMSQDFQLQWEYMGYYAHHQMKHGYTNRGQSLGAGSGYFGNSQFLGYRVYYPRGSTMVFFHRYCPDINYILNKAVYKSAKPGDSTIKKDYWANYEAYLTWGAETSFFFFKSLCLTGTIGYTYISNRNYIRKNYVYGFEFSLRAKYNF